MPVKFYVVFVLDLGMHCVSSSEIDIVEGLL